MIFEIDFSNWNFKETFKDVSEERYQEIRTKLHFLQLPANKEDYYYNNCLTVDERDLEKISKVDLEIKFEVKKIRTLSYPENLKEAAVTQVYIPDMFLMTVNQVDYQEDCCTDVLQEKLDDGWRIIAVCPPIGDRRPTHILGRHK